VNAQYWDQTAAGHLQTHRRLLPGRPAADGEDLSITGLDGMRAIDICSRASVTPGIACAAIPERTLTLSSARSATAWPARGQRRRNHASWPLELVRKSPADRPRGANFPSAVWNRLSICMCLGRGLDGLSKIIPALQSRSRAHRAATSS